MTQGKLLSPKIFNVVVDTVIRHWVTVVKPTEAGTGGLALTIINLAACFYADDGLVASTQPESLQRAFDALTGLFDWVGLHTNTESMVGMVCQPCHTLGRMLEESYERRPTVKGPKFRECQRRRVECPECRVEVAVGLLMTHRQSQHGVGQGDRGGGGPTTPPPPPPPPPGEAQI